MILPSLTEGEWAAAIAAALCTGLSKSGFGGFGILTVLLMASIMPAKESTGAVLPMLIAADLMAIGAFRKHADWRELARLLPATLVGLLFGWVLMTRIPGDDFGRFLGWVVLLMMLLVLWQRFDRRILATIMRHRSLSMVSGFVAGITTMVANAGGPAMTFHLLARQFDKMAFVGTSAWFFFVVNVLKVPLSLNLGLISDSSLLLDLTLLPAIILGMVMGRYFLRKIPQAPFDWLLIGTGTVAALRLVLC